MDDLGVFARDFGLRPQGKAAPMSASRSSAAGPAAAAVVKPSTRPSGGWSSADSFHDVFGGPPRSSFAAASSTSSAPVYDKPVYDDDIFDGVPGVRASTGSVFDDVFAPPSRSSAPLPMDGLLENLGKPKAEPRSGGVRKAEHLDGFEDLIPGFSRSSPPQQRASSEINHVHSKKATSVSADPFVVLEKPSSAYSPSSSLFTDPLENINRTTIPESTNIASSNEGASPKEGEFDETDDFEMLAESVPSYTASVRNDNQNDTSSQRNIQNDSFGYSTSRKESPKRSTVDLFEHLDPKMKNAEDNFELDGLFDKPLKHSTYTKKFTDGAQNSDFNVKMSERDVTSDVSPRSVDADEVWLTVTEIPLFTLPTTAPSPSRAPPNISKHHPSRKGDYTAPFVFDEDNKVSFRQSNQNKYFSERLSNSVKSGISRTDETLGRSIPQTYANEHADVFPDEKEIGSNSAAAESVAAMKVAMDRAEVKFKQAREVREKVHDTKSTKIQQFQNQGDPTEIPDVQDDEDKKQQERLKHERAQREREEEEKRRERKRELELEKERERARQAVERATREARERAAVEARLKAERSSVEKANAEARERAAVEARLKAERSAVEKANTEARLRAERAAVQKVAAEARERAAADARERAERAAAAEAKERAERAAMEASKERLAEAARERAAAEVREKAVAAQERAAVERAKEEARHRAEKAAVERAAAEARERAFAESRARAAATAREHQYNDNDIESFFGMGGRATSAPKQRANSSETIFDTHNRAGMDGVHRTSGGPSTFKKASSTTNMGDDLTFLSQSSLFNGFQEIEGETEERRRSRTERQQRTLERAAKALAEKNERDLQVQREQAERHRMADTLDIEIKRWAAGKEGNLRALLSTLQYVLWPECGWQPVSLTDLITAISVKKVYRKATLCIHPDKVQQKGANLQQKYIAEKVFDILKEAWNKFNSEELF